MSCDNDVHKTGIPQTRYNIFHNRSATQKQHRLWPVIRERPHPAGYTCRQYYRLLHNTAPFFWIGFAVTRALTRLFNLNVQKYEIPKQKTPFLAHKTQPIKYVIQQNFP